MKVKETIERDCCHWQHDLREYRGTRQHPQTKGHKEQFCIHCGQLWKWDRKPGDMDYGWERVTAPI